MGGGPPSSWGDLFEVAAIVAAVGIAVLLYRIFS